MSDIRLPAFIPLTEKISSKNLAAVFAQKEPVNYLREIYQEDNKHFFNLIDEMKLRGIALLLDPPNEMFPDEVLEEPYLIVKQNGEKFKELNFELLGLHLFVNRFLVQEDEFFNYIPLAGFMKLNSALDIETIKDVFIEKGFLIVGEQAMNQYPEKPEVVQVIMDAEEDSRLIREVFSDTKYLSFLRFCSVNNLTYISEIEPAHIKEYQAFTGVGVRKYSDFLSLWERVNNHEIEIGSETETVPLLTELSFDDEKTTLVHEVFSDTQFQSFLRYCAQNNLDTISQITAEHIEDYRSFYGVGIKRYNEFLIKWKNTINCNENTDNAKGITAVVPSISYGFKIPLPIREAFSSAEYNAFVNFCERQEIKCVTELQITTLEKFSNVKSIRRKTVENVELRMEELLMEEESYIHAMNQPISTIPIYSVIEKMSIGELLSAVNPYMKEELSETQLQSGVKNIDDLPKEIRNAIVKDLIHIKQLDDLADELRQTVNERVIEMLNLRYNPEETLETIGNKIGVTRERVRQIIKKNTGILLKKAMSLGVNNTLGLMKTRSFGIAEEKIRKSLQPENLFLLLIYKDIQVGFHYIPKAKLFLTNDELELSGKVLEQLDDLPELLMIEEFRSFSNEILRGELENDKMEKELHDYLLEITDRKKFGNYLSRSSITLTKKLEVIFEHHLTEPLVLNEYGKTKIDQICDEMFGMPTETSLRSVEGRIRDIEKIILVDNLTFEWIDESILENPVFDEIQLYMDQQLETSTHINAEQVFEQFKEKLYIFNIQTKLHLYSLIKYLFDDQYTIGKGNTLNIYRDGTTLYSLDERLEKTLLEADKDYTIWELAEKLKYKKSTIDLTISKSSKYVTWDHDQVRLVSSLGITEEERVKFKEFIEQYMSEGFSTTLKLLQECQFDSEMSAFLQAHEIQTDYVLGSLIKKLIPNIKGHTVFLNEEQSEITSFEEAITKRFPKQTTRKEIVEYILEYGYSTAAASQMLYSLFRKNNYVSIDTDQLYNRSNLEISDEAKEALSDYLGSEFQEKYYLVVSELHGYRRKLPKINPYRWTPHLIHTLALELGYKHIKSVDDYRYDRLVIVKNSSLIYSLDEIVYKELTENYEGPLHVTEVAKHLKELGLLWSDERLPFELVNSKFFKIDDFGRMTMKGSRR